MITTNGRGVVRHYLQDVGSTFGMGANGPHDWDEGWEYLYEGGADPAQIVLVWLHAQPMADGFTTRNIRPLAASKATRSTL